MVKLINYNNIMATLKQAIAPKKQIRQCPKCKSKKGFRLNYSIGGNGSITATFTGKIVDSEREMFDTNDSYAECLNCGKTIDTEHLEKILQNL